MKNKTLYFFLLLLISLSCLPAQTAGGADDPAMISTRFDTSGFPQWAKDLRRAEIVAFGSFPFMYFFTNFGFDAVRCASHGWNRSYAPWPFQSAGGVEKTQSEKLMTLGIAAGGSILLAIIDYSIEKSKRNREEREIRNLPPGTPIIIRKPLSGENGGDGETETEAGNP